MLVNVFLMLGDLRNWQNIQHACTRTREAGSYLDADRCQDHTPLQSFVMKSGLIRLTGSELCLTVGGEETERPAGPFYRRDLTLEQCRGGRDQLWTSLT